MKKAWAALVLIVAAAVGFQIGAVGETVPGYDTPEGGGTLVGCYNCVLESHNVVGYEERCKQVGHAQSGEGIYCEESCEFAVLPCTCATSGGSCFNVTVSR